MAVTKVKPVAMLDKPTIDEPFGLKEKYSLCEMCGCSFEQQWDKTLGVYDSFKDCPDCRKNKQRQSEKSDVSNYRIDYVPFGYQQIMHDSEARFRIVSGGIRTGKDYSMVFELVKYLVDCGNEDRPDNMIPKVRGWIVAPSDDIAKEDFNQLKRIVPREMVTGFSKSTNKIELVNGVEIECKSAYDPESLVGVGLDVVLITEAARIKDLEDVWSNLEGRLTSPGRGKNGMGGIGLINSSPLGKNYFYKMWTWGNRENPDYDSDWESFKWSHWDNPLMKEKENRADKKGITYRQRLERRMSKARYRQDYLAEFISDDYPVFPDFEKKCLEKIPLTLVGGELEEYIENWRKVKPYHSYTIGYDPAKVNDEPILWVVENETGKLMKAINMKGMDWDPQFDMIAMTSRQYNHAVVNFGRTGHETIDSQLIKRGLVTCPLNEQGANKANLVENLARVIQNGQLTVLDDLEELTETIKFEFNDYVREQKKTTVEYKNATSDSHDDHISAGYFVFANVDTIEFSTPYVGLMSAV